MTKFTLSCQCLIGPCSVLRFKGLPSSCRCAMNQGSFSTSDEFLQTGISSSGNCCDGITLIKRGQILKIKIRIWSKNDPDDQQLNSCTAKNLWFSATSKCKIAGGSY